MNDGEMVWERLEKGGNENGREWRWDVFQVSKGNTKCTDNLS